MCGRYKLSAPGNELWEHFDVHGDAPSLVPRFNIAPTQPIAIMATPHQIEEVRWGLRLPNPKAGGFNVRVESLGAPLYRDAIRTGRCLILADGFYEWRREGTTKQAYLIERADRAPFAFAGIWQMATSPSGQQVPAAAILTTAARARPREIHDRMPVVLQAAAHAEWLDPAARYQPLLQSDADPLVVTPISARVNSASNDDPSVVEPLTIP